MLGDESQNFHKRWIEKEAVNFHVDLILVPSRIGPSPAVFENKVVYISTEQTCLICKLLIPNLWI
jgi:hypothetical protein